MAIDVEQLPPEPGDRVWLIPPVEQAVAQPPPIRMRRADVEPPAVRAIRQEQAFNRMENELLKTSKTISESDWKILKIGELFKRTIQPVEPVSYELAEKFLNLHSHLRAKHPYVWKDPKVLVGVEVEVENVLFIEPNIPLCFWAITEDGSLRNRGREFKTKPLPLTYLEAALTQLFNGLNPDIDFSKRCSIHFHFDVRFMTIEQSVGLMLSYSAVENLLFKFVMGDRRKNIFCVPITETLLLHKQKGDAKSFILNIKDYWHKYTALNLLPMGTLGTVEFRQMPGINDVQKLLIWADLLSRLRIFAYKHSLEDITNMVNQLNTTSEYRKFVESIFGELTIYLDMTALAHDMDKPVYVIKNSTMNNQYQRWLFKQKPVDNNFFSQIFIKDTGFTKLTQKQLAALEELWVGFNAGQYRDRKHFYTALVEDRYMRLGILETGSRYRVLMNLVLPNLTSEDEQEDAFVDEANVDQA